MSVVDAPPASLPLVPLVLDASVTASTGLWHQLQPSPQYAPTGASHPLVWEETGDWELQADASESRSAPSFPLLGEEGQKLRKSVKRRGLGGVTYTEMVVRPHPRQSAPKRKAPGDRTAPAQASPRMSHAKRLKVEGSECPRGPTETRSETRSESESADGALSLSLQWHCSLRVRLPLCLSLETWKRHAYSLEDVATVFKYASSRQLWQLALSLGLPPNPRVSTAAFQTLEAIHVSCKAAAITRVLAVLKALPYEWPQESVLDTELLHHIPPVPAHVISPEWYQELHASVAVVVSFLRTVEVPRVFAWKGAVWAALNLEVGAVYLCRVVDPETHASSHWVPSTWLTRSYTIRDLSTGLLWYSVEEGCVVRPATSRA